MKCCHSGLRKNLMSRLPYHLKMPVKRDTAVVVASPHSGRDYPWDFIRDSLLDELTIRSSEDAYVDLLFESVPDFGAPLLCATLPRAFVDLNRAPDELDPALIAGSRQTGHNARISSGLGVIPRVVANGREIRQGKISLAEAQNRLSDYYFPYHDKLSQLLNEARDEFGFCLLIDCHSMPREALLGTSYAFSEKPDIVLGDRFGATCDPEVFAQVEAIFRDLGLRTARNLPFAGAYVTQKYGKPALGQHALQIEIDRSLYMDEAAIEPNADFEAFQQVMQQAAVRLTDIGRQDLRIAAQ